MSNLLEKNLEYFKNKHNPIYDMYSDYSPKRFKFVGEIEGNYNIVEEREETVELYPSNPSDFNKEMVQKYLENPYFYEVNTSPKEILGGEKDVHITHMNRLLSTIVPYQRSGPCKQPYPDFINLMFMLGCGTGEQILELYNKTNIRNLIIIEPEEEIFYTSLYSVDWEHIISTSAQRGGTVSFFIGMNTDEIYESVLHLLRAIGVHNSVKPYFYNAMNSEKIKEIGLVLKDKLPAVVTALGYYDDERISFAHTISNLINKIPVLVEHPVVSEQFCNVPAIVVGNGPSLDDEAIQFIKDNQEGSVVISAGTALGSLYAAGIKPDIHVEIERTKPVYEYIKQGTDPEYLKDITLIALNTVHPEVFNLFNRTGMGLKANDFGMQYISTLLNEGEYGINLAYSNPTVGNGALAVSIALGIKELYLVGMDFALTGGSHHSKNSIHYRLKDKTIGAYRTDGKVVPANFGGEVGTLQLLNSARLNCESLFQVYNWVQVFNTSKGALIKGAKPRKYEDIDLDSVQYKSAIVNRMFNHSFSTDAVDYSRASVGIQDKTQSVSILIDKLLAIVEEADKVSNYYEGYDLLSKLHGTVEASKSEFAYYLIKGTIYSFNMAMSKCLVVRDTLEDNLALFKENFKYYKELLIAIKDQSGVAANLLELDSRTRDISSLLKDNNNEEVSFNSRNGD